MKPLRFLSLLAALCVALPAAAQEGGLTPFRSDAELTRYLRELQERAEAARRAQIAAQAPAQPACASTPNVTRGRMAPAGDAAVITGTVVNGGNQPIVNAVVTLSPSGLRVATGADGSFRIQVPAAHLGWGAVSVGVGAIGYAAPAAETTLSAGDSVRVEFKMCEQALSLNDVVVTGASVSAAGYASADRAEGITNNQQAGVDEGGIVKVHGNHLVVLRRGRLFTLAIGGDSLRPVDAVDAYRPGGGDGWYDEMLISGDQIIVIGYTGDGTELGLFRIGANGRLRHRDTYTLRSSDYYSSENYASRLIGTRLIVYSPVPVELGPKLEDWMPAMRRWRAGGDDDEFRRTLAATRIYRAPGVDPGDDATLHTVTTCEFAASPVRCQSTAVVGPEGRVFYVSPTAVYVWAGGNDGRWGPVRRSVLYRLPLDGSAPRALGVRGSPIDQFSFLEQDGMLNVVVSDVGAGDGMWNSQRGRTSLALLRVPLSSFGDGRQPVASWRYRPLPAPANTGVTRNRFVGSHLLYGDGGGWGAPAGGRGGHVVQVVRITDGRATALGLTHPVDRIEVLGRDAVIAGADERDLHFTGIRLALVPSIAQRYTRRNAAQGETRSHGFFYRPDGDDSGLLGLPIRGAGEPGVSQLTEGSASILFLRNANREFRELGELAADARKAVDDACVASCADWYGNARPIFLRGRIFALMGYEMVEGTLDDGRLRERRRVNFAPRPHAGSARSGGE
ncbi:MAG TPA: beta-propeller domain-containing protein [Longimicrobium sp.]|jgi:hypothetical protein